MFPRFYSSSLVMRSCTGEERVRAGSHVSYPPPNRFMMAPVSILGGGAEERMGAGELNTSAGEGKVEMVFRAQTHSNTHKLLTVIHYNAHLSNAVAVHTVHVGMGKEVRVIY